MRLRVQRYIACLATAALVLGCGGSDSINPTSPTAFLGTMKRQQVGDVNYAYYQFGSGKPLVMVQAFGMTTSNWTLPLLRELSKTYQVTIFDNRGMGFSTDASSTPLTLQAMADSTVGLMDALKIAKPDILGWSLGAETIFTIAATHPGRVNRIISVGGDVGSPATVPPTAEFLAVAFNPASTVQQACDVLFPPGHQAEIDAYIAGWQAMPTNPTNPDGSARQAEAYEVFSASTAIWDAVPDIHNPVLLITGAEDEGCPPANAETLVKRLPNAYLFEVANSGHAVLFQDQALCLEVIRSFLAGK